MNRILRILTLALSLTATVINAQASGAADILKPDFAYPQDVIKTAESFLAAKSSGSTPQLRAQQLLAVSEIAYASESVDKLSYDKNITLALELSDKYITQDPDLSAMLKAYAADVATTASNLVPWNRAQLEVRPVDMESWTRKDFQIFADSLYGVAYDVATPDAPLERFGQSLKIDRLGYRLTPAVRDFIYLKWHGIKSVYRPDRAIVSHLATSDSPLYFYLAIQNEKYEDKMEFCRRNKAKSGSEFALYGLFVKYSYLFDYPTKNVYDFLLEMKQAYPGNWVTPMVDTQIKNQLRPVVRIISGENNITPQGCIFTVKCQNVDTVKVTAYGWRNCEKMEQARRKGIYTGADYVRRLNFAANAGVESKTVTDTLNLPDANYLFVYNQDTDPSFADFAVMPWRVVSYSTKEGNVVAVLDALTGKPAVGVDVIVKYYNGRRFVSLDKITDRSGLVRFDHGTGGSIWLQDKGNGLYFNADCYLHELDNDRDEDADNTRFSIVVDRSVYRPGETVRWTAVAMNDKATVEGVNVKADVTYPVPDGGYKSRPDTTLAAGTTDRYGRVHGEFVIPADVATGRASIGVNDERKIWFDISEFKLRDLQIKDIRTVVTADSVTVTGRAVNYTGVGLSGIDIILAMNINLAEDNDTTMELRSTSVEDGMFTFNFKRAKDANRLYVSVSLHASSPDGRSADSGTSYPTSFDATVYASVENPVDISKGMKVKVTGTDYAKADKQTEFAVGWELTQITDDEQKNIKVSEGQGMTGDINIAPEVLRNVNAGEYRLGVYALDCPSDTMEVIVRAYNPKKSGLPDKNAIVWLPETTVKVAGDNRTLSFLAGVRDDSTTLYWMSPNGKSEPTLNSVTLSAGYHTVNIDLPSNTTVGTVNTMPVWAVKNGRIYTNIIHYEIEPETEKTLNLTCETFRDRVNAGGREQWSLVTRFGDRPVPAAVTVNIYNTQLDEFGMVPLLSITPGRDILRPYLFSSGDVGWLNIGRTGKLLNLEKYLVEVDWLYKPLGFGYNVSRKYAGAMAMRTVAESADFARVEDDADGFVSNESVIQDVPLALDYDAADITSSESESEIDNGDDVIPTSNPAIISQPRTTTVLNALWSPMLTTGDDGRVDIDFLVPDQTTRWRMTAVAWTTGLASAKLVKTFDAVKPILVAPNLPRFVRVGDKVNLVSAITNATDTVQTVNYRMEVKTTAQDSPAYSFSDGRATIKPRSTYYVTTTCVIDDALASVDSIAVTMRAGNGTYGDGERRVLPVLTSSAFVTESVNFYLNPGDSVYTLINKDIIKDAATRLSFTANPMWTVVESLPKALEPSYDVAPSLVMSLYSAMSALKIVAEHPEASSVIDVVSARKTRDEALHKLSGLQTADGGFRWGKWSDRPDVYTTLTVLEWLDEDAHSPEVATLTAKALEFVDNNIHQRNAKIEPDLFYTYVRSAYGKPTTLDARQIFDATANHINRTWKKMSVENKSTAAMTMYRTGNRPMAREIMRSVAQFGTVTADRGLIFHNMRSIVGYATLLRAMSTIEPTSTDVDAVRQALLYLRQGMDWGSSAHTTYAVRAMMTGSTWVVNRTSDDIRVEVDSEPITIDSVAAHTGAIDVAVEGKTIEIERKPGTPAYGALITRYVAPLSDIEAFSDGEISIEKNIYAVNPEGERVAIDRAKVHAGDRLVVSLTIKAARPLTGIILNDMRPAAFEPVRQLSHYSWRGELGYYIENRDSATNIYLYYVPRGSWTIEYDVTVNTTGTFTTGMATATSTVDANLTAHSSSSPFTIVQ